MKTIVALAVLSCGVMIDAASIFGVPIDIGNAGQIGSRVGSHVGKSFGDGLDLGIKLGSRLLGVGRNRANLGGNYDDGLNFMDDNMGDAGFGNPGLGGAESRGNEYKRGRNEAAQNYDHDAESAANQAAHNAGAKEFHNTGQHHSKTTSVSQSEDDGSHNVGGSEAHNVGEQAGRAYKNRQSGAAENGNNYAEGAERSDIVN